MHHESLEVQESSFYGDDGDNCEEDTNSDEDEVDLAIYSPEDLNERKRCNAHEEYKLFGPSRQQKVESRMLEFVNAASVCIPNYERSAPRETVEMIDVFTVETARKEIGDSLNEGESGSAVKSSQSPSLQKLLHGNIEL